MADWYERTLETPRDSFFLFGVRGVGKSTWARTRLPKAKRFDLLDQRQYHDLLTDPGAFGEALRALGKSSWVVVDEVQRLPGLLNEVHRAIEERGLRFALLGSSARKLKVHGTNLLAGRAALDCRSLCDHATDRRYPGRLERVTEDGIEILPVEAFVEILESGRL